MKCFSSGTGSTRGASEGYAAKSLCHNNLPLHPDKCKAEFNGFPRRCAKVFFCLFIAAFFAAPLAAQTAAEMDGLLETKALSFARAARFVLVTAGLTGEASPPGEAYSLAAQKGWLPEDAAPDRPIATGELCFLIMRAFNMKGSFLYSLFPGPRYAFREFAYLKLLPGRRDPGLPVSGDGFLWILAAAASQAGIDQAAAPKPEEPALPQPAAALPGPALPGLAALAAGREEMAREISAELEERQAEDTSVRIAEEGVVISLDNIQFLPDSTELTEGEKNKLRGIAAILSRYPDRKILVGGHTAMAGSAEGRLRISRERAASVASYLVSLNVGSAEDIIVRGYGASSPLGDNAAASGQALNRRVEIILLDERR
jgi:outer membrane protein OmpA-like peptidoglycan-associated protein